VEVSALDAASGLPLADAEFRVRIESEAASEGRIARSGPDGAFVLDRLAAGDLHLAFDHEGSRPAEARVSLTDGGPSVRLEVAFEAGAEVLGAVQRLDGRPAPDAVLEWVPASAEAPRREVVTGADGRYRVSGLVPGLHAVGIYPRLFRAVWRKAVPQPVEIAGDRSTVRDFRVDLGSDLAVTVGDADGRPVEGVEVRFSAEVGGRGLSGFLPPTGPDGMTACRGAPGSGTILFEVPPGASGDARLEVDLAAPPAAVRLDLRPSRRIEGEAVGETGTPIAGARVVASCPGGGPEDGAIADDDGRFTFFRPRGEGFRLEASCPAIWLAGTVEVPPAEGSGPLRVVLRRGATVAGRVVDPGGHPVPGARVVLSGEGGRREALADPGGRFAFAVSGRSHDLSASDAAFAVPAVMQGTAAGTPVELVLGRGGSIRGRVVLPGGRPLRSGASIAIVRAAGLPAGAPRRTGPDGWFSIDGIRPGPLSLRAWGPEFSFAASAVVEVREGAEAVEVEIPIGEAPALEVVVVDGEREARIDGALVSLASVKGSCDRRTGGGGVARFPFLPPGAYELEVEAPGGSGAVRRIEWPRDVTGPLVIEVGRGP